MACLASARRGLFEAAIFVCCRAPVAAQRPTEPARQALDVRPRFGAAPPLPHNSTASTTAPTAAAIRDRLRGGRRTGGDAPVKRSSPICWLACAASPWLTWLPRARGVRPQLGAAPPLRCNSAAPTAAAPAASTRVRRHGQRLTDGHAAANSDGGCHNSSSFSPETPEIPSGMRFLFLEFRCLSDLHQKTLPKYEIPYFAPK